MFPMRFICLASLPAVIVCWLLMCLSADSISASHEQDRDDSHGFCEYSHEIR